MIADILRSSIGKFSFIIHTKVKLTATWLYNGYFLIQIINCHESQKEKKTADLFYSLCFADRHRIAFKSCIVE